MNLAGFSLTLAVLQTVTFSQPNPLEQFDLLQNEQDSSEVATINEPEGKKGSPELSALETPNDNFAAGLILRFQAGETPVDPSGNVVGSELTEHKLALGPELSTDLYSVTFTEPLPGSVAQDISAKLSQHPMIVSAEPDYIEEITQEETQSNAPWHLDRIDERSLVLDKTYTNISKGAGVTIYIVDTGVRSTHVEFEGRASTQGFTNIYDGRGTEDCQGHGTHVAATAAGKTYGVAKKAKIVSVRVLDCNGSGTKSQTIQGINWIINTHPAGVPAVANFSLGGGISSEQDQAIRNLVARGITVVVASGNDNDDACRYSPARVSEAITVNNSSISDGHNPTSNYGSCTDIYAPGTNIVAAGHTSDTALSTKTGTSMATPVVAGAAAVILSSRKEQGLGNTTTPAQVWDLISEQATTKTFRTSDRYGYRLDDDAKLLLYAVPKIKPNAPRSVRASLVLVPSRAIASWSPPSMYFINNAVSSYTARAWSAQSGGQQLGSCTTSSTSCSITGISSSRPVWVDVRASNSNGSGVTSARVSSGAAISAPTSARNLALTTGDSSIAARWSAPTSTGGSPISGYKAEAYLDRTGGTPVRSCTTKTTSCTITGLENGTQYFVNVLTTTSATLTSVLSTRLAATPLINQTLTPTPTISGVARVGNTLIGDPKTWDDGTTQDIVWRVAGTIQPLPDGQNPLEFQVLPEHVGKKVAFEVTSSRDLHKTVTRKSSELLVSYQAQPTFSRPSIEGVAVVGETLVASSGITDESFTSTFTWKRDGVAIAGSGTGEQYTLTSSDASKKITVSVTSSSVGFYTVTRTSAPTAVVTGTFISAPTPTIRGNAVLGQTLTAVTGSWSPSPALKYQWLRSGRAVAGQTKATYKLGSLDLGKQISVRVTGSRSGFGSRILTSARTTAVLAPFTSKPTFTISVPTRKAVGSVLTMVPSGSWSPAPSSIGYQWFRNGEPIAERSTSSSYTLTEADRGALITAEARAVRGNYITAAVLSSAVQPLTGTPMSSAPIPTISGFPVVGESLTATVGTWESTAGVTLENLQLRWFSGTTLVSSGSDTYSVTSDDAGKKITFSVTGSLESFQTVTRTSAPTAVVTGTFISAPTPTIRGNAVLGQTLTAVTGSWSPSPALQYQWLRSGRAVAGQTKATYKLASIDVGKQISVRVTGSKSGYPSTTLDSESTAVVLNAFTSKPTLTISGPTSPTVGSLLKLVTSGSWSPATGISFGYQWFRNGEPIGEITTSTQYRLTEADIGANVSATLTATRADTESTQVVSKNSVRPIGYSFASSPAPKVSGLAVVGETLRASIDFWDEQVSFDVNWFSNGTLVSSGSDQYRIQKSDHNKRITFSVTGSRENFSTLSRTSAPTAAVTARFSRAPNPTVSGTMKVGNTLTASAGSWSASPAFSYQWLRNNTAIPGAKSKTYKLQPADFGARVSVRVTGNKRGYHTESRVFSQTRNVAAGAFSRKGTTVITGTLGRSKTLRAAVSGWSPGPTKLTYQWRRDGQVISGATKSSYKITNADLARAISVTVSIQSTGYTTASQSSRSRTDWKMVTRSQTVTAASQFSQCTAYTYGGWHGFGGTYRPCSIRYNGAFEFYDPSSGFMIVRDYFNLPAGTKRWQLTFNNFNTRSRYNFAFASTDSSQRNSSNWTFFPSNGFWDQGYLTTPWVSQISDSRAYYIITGSSSGYGFMTLQSITLTYETVE
jgi:subtilisin family serine protease